MKALKSKAKPVHRKASATARRRASDAPRGHAVIAGASRAKATTLRILPKYEEGLRMLKRYLGMPANKMINEAIGEYIQSRSLQVERSLNSTLEELKAYRRNDPNFEQAFAEFVNAEALHGKDDPVEGTVVEMSPSKSENPAAAGPTQAMIRDLISGSR